MDRGRWGEGEDEGKGKKKVFGSHGSLLGVSEGITARLFRKFL
jgi:hypothetical protein